MTNRVKVTRICAEIGDYTLNTALTESYVPRVGDVAVFEVLNIGKHLTIQSDTKRIVKIMPGDQIMAAFGNRYATEQFEGYVPDECRTEFHILGAGGTVGLVHSTHAKFSGAGPTRLRIIGYATDAKGNIINTKQRKQADMLPFSGRAAAQTKVILSIGSSMDSGKTTTAAHLVHGLVQQNRRVVFIKLTGTVFTKDCDLNYDFGADQALDFGDMGFPSTFLCEEEELLSLYETLVHCALESSPDFIVMEIADGIYQRETKMLLNNQPFMQTIHQVIFSACDSLAAVHGVQTLRQWGIEPFALCGMFTTSPLLIKEVGENVDVPVFNLDGLMTDCTKRLLSLKNLPAEAEVPVYLLPKQMPLLHAKSTLAGVA